jgi:N-acetylmuramoyl-L-alanine amidase
MLAECIQNSVTNVAGLTDRGIYQANFYVLKHTTMPAMLLETAFISNPNEEDLLIQPEFQQKMAQGIVDGLNNFFTLAANQGGGN